jgi:membrane-associated phospholipid phosphatase
VLSPSFAFQFVASGSIASVDHEVATWFHGHLTQPLIDWMLALSNAASPFWIAAITATAFLTLVLRKHWFGLLTLVLTVPGGMLFHHFIQIVVRRERPFRHSEFLDLGGYSFPSGHTMAATLLYGLLATFALLAWKSWHRRFLVILGTALVIGLVGFSRIALGAHYLTDVLAAVMGGGSWLMLCLVIVEQTRRIRSSAYVPVKPAGEADQPPGR